MVLLLQAMRRNISYYFLYIENNKVYFVFKMRMNTAKWNLGNIVNSMKI